MAKRISRNGLLYIFYKDFSKDYNVSGLSTIKEKITNNYFNRVMPSMYEARAQAAFGNQANISEIDNFLFGVNGSNQGYIQKLQAFFDDFYSDSYRNAEQLFTSEVNKTISNLIKRGPVSFTQLEQIAGSKGQLSELQRMMAQQNEILDNMSRLASITEGYALFMANNNRAASGKYLSMSNLQQGAYNLKDFTKDGQQALKMYQDIQETRAALGSQAVGGGGMLKQNFVSFRTTADKFHAKYGEYLATLAGFVVGAGTTKMLNQLNTAVHTGTQSYHVGKNGINIKAEYVEDPVLKQARQILSDEQLKSFGTFTVNNDTTFKIANGQLLGEFGGTVKEYSDKSVDKFNGVTSLTSFSNLFTAAALATQYGLPANMASKTYIYSLGGSISGQDAIAESNWKAYIELLGTLLSLDALMGRMANNKVSNEANSLIFFYNGKVYGVRDIVQGIVKTQGSVLKSSLAGHGGLWSLANGIVNRSSIEKAHEEVLDQKRTDGKSRSTEAEEAVEKAIRTLTFKIGIDLLSLMKYL